jgi:glycosyltransferase involved in cell wall biosynthesis
VKISAIVITFNEEKNIGACLASISFADEIVVVDSGSTDRTEEICREDPRVRWNSEEWKGFGRQKNSALDKANGPWIFSIDADERVTPDLAGEIARIDPDASPHCGYRVPRKSFFGGEWVRHCGWYPDETVRLFRKEGCRFEEREVHEAVRCDGPVGRLKGTLLHYTYRDTSDYVTRMNRYSSLAALELRKEGRRASGVDLAIHPLFAFFKTYVLKRGFLDGMLGLKVSVLYSFYTFYKYVKAWEAGAGGKGTG